MSDSDGFGKLQWGALSHSGGTTSPTATAQERGGRADATSSAQAAPPADRGGSRRPAAAPSVTLSLPGAFPSSGPGAFVFASTSGRVMGTAGPLRRFRLGIEDGVDEDMAAFAAKVDQTLGDPRDWTADGELRLQRVAATNRYDFTIYLATPQTAGAMCAQGGLDITVDGQPFTSCRVSNKVILNLARWRLSVPDYVSAQISLDTYRTYMITHEVGHQLGHGHELCPGKGRPAPVMQQQTLGLQGCVANPWPYVNGKRYSGAPTR